MAFHTRDRINPAVDLVLAEIIATVRQRPFRGILVLVTWLYFLLVGMAIGTKGFFVADGAGKFLLLGIVPVLLIKADRFVIELSPVVSMTFGTVGKTLNLFRVVFVDVTGIDAGIEKTGN